MKAFLAIFVIIAVAQVINAHPDLGDVVNNLLGTTDDNLVALLKKYNLPFCSYVLTPQIVGQLQLYGCLPVGLYFSNACLAITSFGGIVLPCGYVQQPSGGLLNNGGLLGTGINLGGS